MHWDDNNMLDSVTNESCSHAIVRQRLALRYFTEDRSIRATASEF